MLKIFLYIIKINFLLSAIVSTPMAQSTTWKEYLAAQSQEYKDNLGLINKVVVNSPDVSPRFAALNSEYSKLSKNQNINQNTLSLTMDNFRFSLYGCEWIASSCLIDNINEFLTDLRSGRLENSKWHPSRFSPPKPIKVFNNLYDEYYSQLKAKIPEAKGGEDGLRVQATRADSPNEAQPKLRAEADAKAKMEAEAKVRSEAESRARADAQARLKAEADAKAKMEAEAKVRAEAESKARADAQARLRAEADAKAKMEAEAKVRAEAEAKARADAQARLRAEADAKAKMEADIKLTALEKARAETEARLAADARSRAEADAKAAAELKAKAEADARLLAELRAKATLEDSKGNNSRPSVREAQREANNQKSMYDGTWLTQLKCGPNLVNNQPGLTSTREFKVNSGTLVEQVVTKSARGTSTEDWSGQFNENQITISVKGVRDTGGQWEFRFSGPGSDATRIEIKGAMYNLKGDKARDCELIFRR